MLHSRSAQAQELRFNVYGAYAFDDKFDSYYSNTSYYESKIVGGLQWGGGIQYMRGPDYGIELLYLRQDTHAPTTYADGAVSADFVDLDLSLNYILLGAGRHVIAGGGKVEGYGGLMLGMVIANAENPDSGRESSATKFAWGIRLGAIIWASDKIGVKLQAQLLSATQAMGGGFYFGTGGAGAGVSSYSSIYQIALGGGLVFKIPRPE
jgi:hypothetical protein